MVKINMKKVINKDKIIEKLKDKSDDIKKYGVKKIGLFGSYSKGDQKRKSDIDILIELDQNTFDNYFGVWRLLEKLFNKEIDLVIESTLKSELNYVKKEAIYVKI